MTKPSPPIDSGRRNACRLLAALPALAALAPAGSAHAAGATDKPLPPSLLAALARAGIAPSACSFDVQWLDASGNVLCWNTAQAMSPASVLKLLPTYVGLQVLGPAWTWQTPVYATAPLQRGVLHGDLVLVGSGDPHLVGEDLWRLAQRLHGLGLRRISGNVVADRSLYALKPHDAAAFDGDALAPYNAGPDPLLFNFDAISVGLHPLGPKVALTLEPPLAGFAPRQLPRLDVDGACGAWKRALDADWSDPLHPRLRGSYAAACGEQTWNLAPIEPNALLHGALAAVFAQAGIVWRGRVVDGRLPPGAQPLTRWESQPLARLVQDINKFSNNVMCEQLFLQLGLQAYGAPADYDKAGRALAGWLAAHDLAMPELVLDNGCGLSRSARISAHSLSRLLRAAWHSPLMPEFLASLPLAAQDGTLHKRFADGAGAGMLHAKTGSLQGVRCLAGYLQTRGGHRASLVAMVNAPEAEHAWDGVFDALLDVILQTA